MNYCLGRPGAPISAYCLLVSTYVPQDNIDWLQIIVLTELLEIYRIVSSKALDQGEASANVMPGERQPIDISKSPDETEKKGCC